MRRQPSFHKPVFCLSLKCVTKNILLLIAICVNIRLYLGDYFPSFKCLSYFFMTDFLGLILE